MPVIGLAVRWWDAGEESGEGALPPPQIKKIFLYTGSVVRVSARSSFTADLRNGGPESLELGLLIMGTSAYMRLKCRVLLTLLSH